MRVYKFLNAQFGLKTLREKQLKISTVDDLSDPFELLPYEMTTPEKRRGLRNARRVWKTQHGVLCFSADWKDPVIWAHYGDKHKGACLSGGRDPKGRSPAMMTNGCSPPRIVSGCGELGLGFRQ